MLREDEPRRRSRTAPQRPSTDPVAHRASSVTPCAANQCEEGMTNTAGMGMERK